MAFITSIADLKDYVGGAVNNSMDINSMLPTIEDAQEKYLLPWMGQEFYDELVEEMPGALAPFVNRALAKLSVYEYAKIGGVQFSDTGLMRAETDNFKTAYKYQENELRNTMLESGYEALEKMLVFLMKNKADYPTWVSGEGYERHTKVMVNLASDFRKYYSSYMSRYTFEVLRPLIEDVEMSAVEAIMPALAYEGLRTKAIDGDGTDMENKAIMYLKKAICQFTIDEGVQRMWVKFDGDKVVQNEILGDQGLEKKNVPGSQAISLKYRHHELWANRYLSKFNKLVNDNVDEFPMFFSVDAGGANEDDDAWGIDTPPVVDEVQCKDKYLVSCGCYGTCTCSHRHKKKGIISL